MFNTSSSHGPGVSNFDTLYEVLEKMDPDTYNEIIADGTGHIVNTLSEIMVDNLDSVAMYYDFILCSVSVNGVLTEEEFVLVKPVIDLILNACTTYEEGPGLFHGLQAR